MQRTRKRDSPGDSRLGTRTLTVFVPFCSISASPSLIIFPSTKSQRHVIETGGPRNHSLAFRQHSRKTSMSFVLIAKESGSNKSLGPGKQGTIIGWVWIMYLPLWPDDWVRNCDWQPHPNHMVKMEEEHFPQGCAEQTKTTDVHPLATANSRLRWILGLPVQFIPALQMPKLSPPSS